MKALLTFLSFVGFTTMGSVAQDAPAPATAKAPVAPAAAEEPEIDFSDLTNPLAEFPAAKAAKPAGPVDPDLPQPFDSSAVTSVVKTSPFNRTVNLSESLVLTGIANIDGKPLATLMDKESKKTYVVSEEPNQQGWRLEEIKPTASIKFSQVKVNIGGEVVTIRHDNEVQEELMKKHKMSPGGGGGPPPGGPPGGDRGFGRDRERSGPSREAMERYSKLSDDAKNKMRKLFEDNRERIMNMSPDDRRSFMENNFKQIAEQDEKGRK